MITPDLAQVAPSASAGADARSRAFLHPQRDHQTMVADVADEPAVAWKRSLIEGFPLVFTMLGTDAYWEMRSHGGGRLGAAGAQVEGQYHCVAIAGFDDSTEDSTFLVADSYSIHPSALRLFGG